MSRWIKIYDSLLEWGWHTRPEMVSLFVHLLIKANVKDGYFEGEQVRRGQMITSLNSLVKLTGISKQTIRTCLKHFEETGEIIQKSTQRNTLITICKYEDYQSKKEPTQHSPNTVLTQSQHSPNTVLTQSIEYKNIDNKKEDIYNNLSSSYSSSSFLTLSPDQQQQEQFLFFEIFFFKNFVKLDAEVERFIATNNSTLWKNKSGKSYDTTEQRIALARLWKQKPVQEPRIKISGFLPAWKKAYERCKTEKPELARAFLDERTDCKVSSDLSHINELQVFCKRSVFEWLWQDTEHKTLIMTPLHTLALNLGKEEVKFYPIK